MEQDKGLVYQIQEKLCELDGSNTESFRLSERLVVGQIYLVPNPKYYSWYHAELKSIANNSAEIQLIDYGDTHPVPLTKFCTLPGDLNTPDKSRRKKSTISKILGRENSHLETRNYLRQRPYRPSWQ